MKGGKEIVRVHPIIIALVFNVLDMSSGIISALKNKDIKSSKLRDGLFKKVGFILCYFMSWLIDEEGSLIGFNIGVQILPIIILYVCTTELVSIIENICKINPDIMPDKLTQLFHISDVKKED